MYLTLEVVSPQAASLGAERRKVVGPEGLTIGRVPGNGWVIPDPYISKQHARISFSGDRFFVEGVGRNPIALGRSDNALGANQMFPLSNGDRLFIDQYEIVVSVLQGEAPGAPVRPAPAAPSMAAPSMAAMESIPAADDPFALISDRAVPPAVASVSASASSPASVIPPAWDSSVLQSPGDTATLDPLAVLGGGARATPEPPPVNWQQASVLNDHVELPSVRASSSGIPTNWDQSVIVPAEPTPPPVPPPARVEVSRPTPPKPAPRLAPQARGPAPPAAGNGAAPWQIAPPVQTPRPEALRSEPVRTEPVRSEPVRSEPVRSEPVRSEPVRQPVRPEPVRSEPMRSELIRTAPSPAPTPTSVLAPERKAAEVSASFAELLRGAGLSERDISPEVLNELGSVLRVVVQGLMEVLQARSEIKTQFRLPLTRVKAAENNPLKLSPNVESALHTLLVQRNPGYLGTVPAFEDAFADIRSHQMAMLEGVRAAFQSMFESFDPKQLEERFDSGAKRGSTLLSNLGGKPKYWDLYKDRYERLAEDPDDTFRRLFGDVFAEAYEKQLERLRIAGRDAGRK